jgi:hypothetical protein
VRRSERKKLIEEEEEEEEANYSFSSNARLTAFRSTFSQP